MYENKVVRAVAKAISEVSRSEEHESCKNLSYCEARAAIRAYRAASTAFHVAAHAAIYAAAKVRAKREIKKFVDIPH